MVFIVYKEDKSESEEESIPVHVFILLIESTCIASYAIVVIDCVLLSLCD